MLFSQKSNSLLWSKLSVSITETVFPRKSKAFPAGNEAPLTKQNLQYAP